MTGRAAVAFVEVNGIVLESARGPAPSLAAAKMSAGKAAEMLALEL